MCKSYLHLLFPQFLLINSRKIVSLFRSISLLLLPTQCYQKYTNDHQKYSLCPQCFMLAIECSEPFPQRFLKKIFLFLLKIMYHLQMRTIKPKKNSLSFLILFTSFILLFTRNFKQYFWVKGDKRYVLQYDRVQSKFQLIILQCLRFIRLSGKNLLLELQFYHFIRYKLQDLSCLTPQRVADFLRHDPNVYEYRKHSKHKHNKSFFLRITRQPWDSQDLLEQVNQFLCLQLHMSNCLEIRVVRKFYKFF